MKGYLFHFLQIYSEAPLAATDRQKTGIWNLKCDMPGIVAYGLWDGLCTLLIQYPYYKRYNFFVLSPQFNLELVYPEAAIFSLSDLQYFSNRDKGRIANNEQHRTCLLHAALW